ncbi:MAG: cation-translocating P-type ATPase, partial [Halobacteriales archaeon]|nr:cation-translocating P-type ATPase [Halobacteriales archaeon]
MTDAEPARPATCTFSVDRRGGRGESGALAIERGLQDLPGVLDAAVSFRTGRVRIRYDEDVISVEELRRAVRERGLTLRSESDVEADEVRTRTELRFEAAFVGLTLVGMAVGLLGDWLGGPPALVWSSYAIAYVFGGWYGLKGAIETLRHRAVDIDLLMILAALGALTIGAPFEGAMLLFLFSLSNVLQHYAIGRSRRAIKSLLKMRPDAARVLRGGEEVTVPIDEIEVGEVIVVRPGDRVPLDGMVVDGESTIDQAALTGESVPVSKGPGDEAFGGTINETGSLEIEVTRQHHESAIARLIHMVEEAQDEKAPTQRLIDRLEQPYVLGVFGLTGAAIALPMLLGGEFTDTFYRAMTLMVAASPCAVVISTPAAVLSAIASGGRQGVLFKGGEHVETAATINAVAFDKTGTLTEGNTRLTDVIVRDDESAGRDRLTEDRLLGLAAAVQARSEHHLAEATVEAAGQRALDVVAAEGFQAAAGKGVRATVDDGTVHIGNRSYYETVLAGASIDGIDAGLATLDTLEAEGKTAVIVSREGAGGVRVLGWLAYTDTLRPGAADMIAELRALGIEHVVMLTGDNERVARRIADEVGIDEVQAEVLPEQKVASVA